MKHTRRKFIKTSAAGSAALFLSLPDTFLLNKPTFSMNKSYELKIMATNWGFRGTLDEFCAKQNRKAMTE